MRKGFIPTYPEILVHFGQNKTAALLFTLIGTYCRGKGEGLYLSKAAIAQKLGCTKAAVCTALHTLLANTDKDGNAVEPYITQEYHHAMFSNYQLPTQYRLNPKNKISAWFLEAISEKSESEAATVESSPQVESSSQNEGAVLHLSQESGQGSQKSGQRSARLSQESGQSSQESGQHTIKENKIETFSSKKRKEKARKSPDFSTTSALDCGEPTFDWDETTLEELNADSVF